MNTITKKNEFLFLDDLKTRFMRGDTILKKALKKCYTKKRSIEINGVQTPIIQPIKKNYRLTLSLLNDPEAIQSFKDFCAEEGILLNPKQKRKGMLSATDLYQQYSYPHAFFNQVLLSCYKKGTSFQANGKETPLVEMCLSGSQQILALNEHKQALEMFKKVCATQNTPLLLLKKQAGMLSAVDLGEMFQQSYDKMQDLLQKCLDENITFKADGEEKPLVQEVKSANVMILVTHPHKDALPHLMRVAAQNGILLKKAMKFDKSSDEFLAAIKEKLARTIK